jgi:hypothetical protein
MSPSTKQALFSIVVLIFLFSACVPAQPTQNPNDVANQVATSVALTVAAQNAQTQSAQSPTPEATNTTLPTQTSEVPPSPTPIPPTVTAVVTVPPTSVPGGGGGGGTTTKREFACDIIRRRPLDNTVFRPGAKFDIKWTIVNTGTKNMVAGLDLHYNSGPQMTSRTRLELPELKPGDQYAVDFDAVAPTTEGHHVMTFIVEGGLCYPYVAIIVEK